VGEKGKKKKVMGKTFKNLSTIEIPMSLRPFFCSVIVEMTLQLGGKKISNEFQC
jgi:hypothetical protein